ncbi:hypothetical protein CLAFUW4_06139 [Fulvia fulva]|uniref:Uncharacterized protein n=1 Tax=Passalora fulva TaxID=5499 RepID=A0A9Q8LIQ8_PASFU|nr:uncharacterized protein CLAFUR5_06283 [Fulvia fulva]KAK4624596.1 hypothetical protein CLAFUR4_06143 [Fulvia fulva]KAK4625240.1 hypothetical protein CLAFUR0_06147 [Fulvia fulva]UJO18147.1 hypothetical protein CLAFUR5_06283 [Fulvia fulva]WPV15606.1 hypothetical protein CLAFUW4_06139 [Fulvia fulva]WPV29869.1 hypothetical protein CLAFUW7_06136 [Fulvia fulva]
MPESHGEHKPGIRTEQSPDSGFGNSEGVKLKQHRPETTSDNETKMEEASTSRATSRRRRETTAAQDMEAFLGQSRPVHQDLVTGGRDQTSSDIEEGRRGMEGVINMLRTQIAEMMHDLGGGRSMSGDEAIDLMNQVERKRKRKAEYQNFLGLSVTLPPKFEPRKPRPVVVKEEPSDS